MRRVVFLLLVLLVPFRSVGAVVVPLIGSPNHQHAAHAVSVAGHESATHHHAAGHASCEGMAQDVNADAGVVHEHACPHLAMATLPPAVLLLQPDRTVLHVDVSPARPLSSVVLEILVPPPTLKS